MNTESQGLAFWGGLSAAPVVAFAALLLVVSLLVLVCLPGTRLSLRRQSVSLRWEMALVFSLVAALSSLAGGLFLGARSGAGNQAEPTSDPARQAQALAGNLDQFAQRHLLALHSLADLVSVTQLEPAVLADVVLATRERQPGFSEVRMVDHDGTVLAAAGSDSETSPSNIRNESYFLQPLASGGEFSRLMRRAEAAVTRLVVSVPVHAASGIRSGVAVGWVDIEAILPLELVSERGLSLTVLDRRRRVVYSEPQHIDPRRVWRLGNASTDVEVRDSSKPYGIAETSQGWTVLIEGRKALAGRDFGGFLPGSWYRLLAVVAGGFLVGWVLAPRVIQPIQRLGRKLDQVDLESIDPDTVERVPYKEVQVLLQKVSEHQSRQRERFRNLQVSVTSQAKARSDLVEQVEAAQTLAEQQEQALEEVQQKLERQSGIDVATGLPTRHAFKQILGRCWKHAERENEPLTLIVVSLDLFADYKDIYGNTASQNCLENMGRILRGAACRPLDRVARCDESVFGVVLANTSESGGEAIAQRVRAQVEAAAINHKGSRFGIVTVSQGISVAFPKEGGTAVATWADAHKALQLAKRRGRNSIVVSAVGTVWN